MATDTQTSTRQFRTRIDIPADRRGPLIDLLNQSLAATLDLMTQSKQAHWNVKGKDFYQLHLLFDEIAESGGQIGHLDLIVADDQVDRIRLPRVDLFTDGAGRHRRH